MKLIYTIVIIILSVKAANCQNFNVEVLRNDTDIVAFRKLKSKMMSQIEDKYFKFPSNSSEIISSLKNVTSVERIEALKKAGMFNAKEYVDEVTSLQALMIHFMKTHQEVNQLNPMRKKEIIIELIHNSY